MLTPEQKKLFKTTIGGSEVAAICGVNPYRSPIDVYFQKTLDDLPDQEEEENNNDNIWLGNALEPIIVAYYKRKFPQIITFPDTKLDPQYPFLRANLDGLLEDGGVLEAKNVGKNVEKKWGQQFTDEIPDEHYLQVAHYARIFKAPYARIVAYFGGSDMRIYEYSPNKIIEDRILEVCINFWENHVLKRIPPPVTTYKDQVKLWKDALADSKKEATPDVVLAIQNYREIQSNIKDLETKSEDLKSIICGFMENSEALIDNAGQTLVTWKNQKTCRFDLPKFKAEQSDLYKQLLVEKQSRVLRISTAL